MTSVQLSPRPSAPRSLLAAATLMVLSALGAPPAASPAGPGRPIGAPDWSRPHDAKTLIVGHYRDRQGIATRNQIHAAIGVARHLHSFRAIPVDVVEVAPGLSPEDAARAYTASGAVEFVEPNYIYHIADLPGDPQFGALWGMHNTGQSGGVADADIDAPEAWDIHTGSGSIVVAVIDTGVDAGHPDLAANMWTNAGEIPGNALDDDGNGIVDDVNGARWTGGFGAPTSGNPADDHGHGTHCAGTIGAVANNGIGVAGVIWNVRIMALKFIASSGSGSTADAVAAIEYAIDEGAHLSSNSWGDSAYSQALYNAIAAAGNAGQLFIAAAGNAHSNIEISSFYPAGFNLDNIISVGATDRTDQRALFSNYGPVSVDLGAPGANILSTRPGNLYQYLSGTSMATPHVAGAAALVLDANPSWTAAEVKNQILASAEVKPEFTDLWQTCGRLNLQTALGPQLPPFVSSCPSSENPPEVESIVRISANPSKASTVKFAVAFSQAVSGVDAGDFCLTAPGLAGPFVSAISGTGTTRTVTVNTGTGSGTLRLDVCDDDTIVNGDVTPLGGSGAGNGDFSSGEVYTIDRVKPTLLLTTPSSTTGTAPIPVTATFSEPVSGFVVSDLILTSCTAANFVPVSASVYTFDLLPTVPSGTVTVRVPGGRCADPAGNTNLASSTLSILFDAIPPQVLSSVRLAANPTRAATVKFRVTFSEAVASGVDVTDFSLTASGVSGASVTLVTGTGATRDVTVNTGSGSGTVKLNVVDDDTIVDLGGNPLGGSGTGNGAFTGGETYAVDKTKPTVVLSTTASDPTPTTPIPVTATFSEPVTGFAASDLTVTNGTVTNLAGSGALYTFDVQPGAPGAVTVRLLGGKVADAAGNTNLASVTLSRTYQP